MLGARQTCRSTLEDRLHARGAELAVGVLGDLEHPQRGARRIDARPAQRREKALPRHLGCLGRRSSRRRLRFFARGRRRTLRQRVGRASQGLHHGHGHLARLVLGALHPLGEGMAPHRAALGAKLGLEQERRRAGRVPIRQRQGEDEVRATGVAGAREHGGLREEHPVRPFGLHERVQEGTRILRGLGARAVRRERPPNRVFGTPHRHGTAREGLARDTRGPHASAPSSCALSTDGRGLKAPCGRWRRWPSPARRSRRCRLGP